MLTSTTDGVQVKDMRNHYGTCELLAKTATEVFLFNDLFTSVQKLLSKAHGSFGISACCSVDRELVVLASRGQAMSAAFNSEHGVVLWGSEASAQAVPFCRNTIKPNGANVSIDTPDVEVGFNGVVDTSGAPVHSNAMPRDNGGEATCTHRYDLDEDGGEIMEIRVVSNLEGLRLEMAQWTASPDLSKVFGCDVDDMGGYFAPFPLQSALHLRVYQQKSAKFLNKEDFQRPESCCAVVAAGTSALTTGNDGRQIASLPDTVAHDLRDIPRVLSFIRSTCLH